MTLNDHAPAPSIADVAERGDASGRRFGFWSATGVVILTVAYFVPLVMGFITLPSPGVPFLDPWYSMMEVLIILTAPLMVLLAIAIHSWAPAKYKPFTLASVVFTALTAGVTSGVHFILITLSHRPDFTSLPWLSSLLSFQWPSVTYDLDILAWDVFFPLSVLFLIPVFHGTRLAKAIRVLLLISGLLAVSGLAGLVFDDMNIRDIGIIGYAVVYPAAAVLLVLFFRRPARLTAR